jgi:Family of unknown function (DUF6893)
MCWKDAKRLQNRVLSPNVGLLAAILFCLRVGSNPRGPTNYQSRVKFPVLKSNVKSRTVTSSVSSLSLFASHMEFLCMEPKPLGFHKTEAIGARGSAAHLLNSIHRKGDTGQHVVGRFGANMRQINNRECRMRSLVGTLGLLAIGYMLVKNLPDILRYIRISRM